MEEALEQTTQTINWLSIIFGSALASELTIKRKFAGNSVLVGQNTSCYAHIPAQVENRPEPNIPLNLPIILLIYPIIQEKVSYYS